MTFRPRHLILPFLLCQMPLWSTALAQTAASTTASSSSSYGSSPGGSAWYGLVTLTLLVVLVAVVLRVFKRMGAAAASDGGIQLLASKALGPRESVVVVKLDGRYFMLGHTPSQVSLIAELEHYSPPEGTASLPGAGSLTTGFASALTSALRKGGRS
jgi:flagellar protein FliO/FliZ